MDHQSSKGGPLTPRSVTWGAVFIDGVLAAGKMIAGLACASQAIFVDGMHSASDLVTDFAVLAGIRIAERPADHDHRYGHRRATTLVAMFIGVLLLAAGGVLGYGAVVSVRRPVAVVRADWPLCLAVATIPIKELLYQVTRHVGRRESDLALLANAWHHRTDVMTSVAAAAGLAGVLLGGPSWQVLDALTALVLSAFLIVVAVRMVRVSAAELADRAPTAETLAGIENAVAGTSGVRGFHAFRARQLAGKVEMDIHVQVDPNFSVAQGHDIASAVEHAVVQADRNVVSVIVHVEPAAEAETPG